MLLESGRTEVPWSTRNVGAPVGKQGLEDGPGGGGASAGLAASIFHFGSYTVAEAKRYLAERGIRVRPVDNGTAHADSR